MTKPDIAPNPPSPTDWVSKMARDAKRWMDQLPKWKREQLRAIVDRLGERMVDGK